jgi:hypothetical protein
MSIAEDNAVALLKLVQQRIRQAVNIEMTADQLRTVVQMVTDTLRDPDTMADKFPERADNIRTSLCVLKFKLQRVEKIEFDKESWRVAEEHEHRCALNLAKAQFEAAISAGCDAVNYLKNSGIVISVGYEPLEQAIFEKAFQRYFVGLSISDMEAICDE